MIEHGRTENVTNRSSDRSFGLVMAGFFMVLGVAPLLAGKALVLWPVIVSIVCLVLALAVPVALAPLNKLWFRFGLVLHRIVSPVVLGILFYLVITPAGMIMRIMGVDPLKRKILPDAKSYWIDRAPPGPKPESLKDQF